jgi:hypothetical protein
MVNQGENQNEFLRVTPGAPIQSTEAPPVTTGVHVYVPRVGFDKITLEAALCVLGSWGILLVIGA